MNNKEAIETIKANYPPAQYTMLREALDMAINLFEKDIVKNDEEAQFHKLIDGLTTEPCPEMRSYSEGFDVDVYYGGSYLRMIKEKFKSFLNKIHNSTQLP